MFYYENCTLIYLKLQCNFKCCPPMHLQLYHQLHLYHQTSMNLHISVLCAYSLIHNAKEVGWLHICLKDTNFVKASIWALTACKNSDVEKVSSTGLGGNSPSSAKKKALLCQVSDKHQFLTKVDWKTWQFTQWNKDIEHDFSFFVSLAKKMYWTFVFWKVGIFFTQC